DHAQGLAGERGRELVRAGLDVGGEPEEVPEFGPREIVNGDQVAWHRRSSVAQARIRAPWNSSHGTRRVPLSPSSAASRCSMFVISAGLPVAATKSIAASIFGPMLPAGNCPLS